MRTAVEKYCVHIFLYIGGYKCKSIYYVRFFAFVNVKFTVYKRRRPIKNLIIKI